MLYAIVGRLTQPNFHSEADALRSKHNVNNLIADIEGNVIRPGAPEAEVKSQGDGFMIFTLPHTAVPELETIFEKYKGSRFALGLGMSEAEAGVAFARSGESLDIEFGFAEGDENPNQPKIPGEDADKSDPNEVADKVPVEKPRQAPKALDANGSNDARDALTSELVSRQLSAIEQIVGPSQPQGGPSPGPPPAPNAQSDQAPQQIQQNAEKSEAGTHTLEKDAPQEPDSHSRMKDMLTTLYMHMPSIARMRKEDPESFDEAAKIIQSVLKLAKSELEFPGTLEKALSKKKSGELRKAPEVNEDDTSDWTPHSTGFENGYKFLPAVRAGNDLWHHVGTVKQHGKLLQTKHFLTRDQEGDDPVGELTVAHKTFGNQIADSAIDPDFRGRGYGKQLYKLAIKHHGSLESDDTVHPSANNVWRSLRADKDLNVRLDDYPGNSTHRASYVGANSAPVSAISPIKKPSKIKAKAQKPKAKRLAASELQKGVMSRKFPYEPFRDRTENETQHAKAWQSAKQDPEIRDDFPRMEGNGRIRAMRNLGTKTKSRKNSDTGEMEFLLHRGMGRLEHGRSVTPTEVKHHVSSSWTPHYNVAQSFARDSAPVSSAWIKESDIKHVPKFLASYEHDQAKNANVSRANPRYKEKLNAVNGNPYGNTAAGMPIDDEHEVILQPHKSQAASKADIMHLKSPVHAESVDDVINTRAAGNPDKARDQALQLRINNRARQMPTKLAASEKPLIKAKSLEKGQNGNWKKEGYKIKHSGPDKYGMHHATAHDSKGNQVGEAEFWTDASGHEGDLYAARSDVHPAHQRKGLASAMYDHAEQATGLTVVPGADQTVPAKKLWVNRVQKLTSSEKPLIKAKSLEKGAPQRLMPYNPEHSVGTLNGQPPVGGTEREAVENWQRGPGEAWQSRADIPRLEGHGRQRAIRKLAAQTQMRRNIDTGEAEFLLHRGHGDDEKFGDSHKTQHSSWTPDTSQAAWFAQINAGHVTSAWFPESDIHHIPNQIGPNMKETQHLKHGASDTERKENYKTKYKPKFAQEHEIIIKPGHKGQLATDEESNAASGNPTPDSDFLVNQRAQLKARGVQRPSMHDDVTEYSRDFRNAKRGKLATSETPMAKSIKAKSLQKKVPPKPLNLVLNGKMKVLDPETGKTRWRGVRTGLMESPDGGTVSTQTFNSVSRGNSLGKAEDDKIYPWEHVRDHLMGTLHSDDQDGIDPHQEERQAELAESLKGHKNWKLVTKPIGHFSGYAGTPWANDESVRAKTDIYNQLSSVPPPGVAVPKKGKYELLDGKHRHLSEKENGIKTYSAYIPAEAELTEPKKTIKARGLKTTGKKSL